MSDQLRPFGDDAGEPAGGAFVDPADQAARQFAVDPRHNVVLEASAGTGKTRVLVTRYLNLLNADVDPANILAITFTRKAAAEMHERIVRALREDASRSEAGRRRWLDLRDRLGEIAISTIDAFCLSLLREFPLEADLDPGFEVADETEVPRLVDLAIDRTLRICLGLAARDADLALVLAQLGTAKARAGLAHLLQRRLVARGALDRFLVRWPRDLTITSACARAVTGLQEACRALPGGLESFVASGPVAHPMFRLLAATLRSLPSLPPADAAAVRAALDRVREHFLTQDGEPRAEKGPHPPYRAEHCRSAEAWRAHRQAIAAVAPRVVEVQGVFDRHLNALLARGVRHLFAIAEREYRQTLDERSVLDFTDLVDRARHLLRQMDEFAQSRFRLESRYHHVLVDEFQDTSRAQWELVQLLIRSWGEGFGLVHEAPLQPTIFVVGDRKQSIYRFRDAEVTVLDDAAAFIGRLREGGRPRTSIRQSLRAGPELLAFVNDVFDEVGQVAGRADAFRYGDDDRFPIDEASLDRGHEVEAPVGLAAANDARECARLVADEIARLCRETTVPDRDTGIARPVKSCDIAILFRSRVSHREFEEALEARGIPAYVYKGLGFFDADEIKDLSALMRYLAEPTSAVRAAAFLRSRLVRLSDTGLSRLAPNLAAALTGPEAPPSVPSLDEDDRAVLARTRDSVRSWLALVDRIPPADLVDEILAGSAYAFELRGPRRAQAWENVKKLRALVRRIQNRGYATLARIADHLDRLHAGDESNAVLDALEAVNLMTVHAAKGLEFPIVFVVNLAKGIAAPPPPVRVVEDAGGEPVVTVGRYVPEADEDEKAKELEETKRLLYVALTRARSRLYLATVLKDGRFAPGPGSLGSVAPEALKQALQAAGADPRPETFVWTSARGRSYRMRVCRPADAREPIGTAAGAAAESRADDLEPISALPSGARMPVTESTRRPDPRGTSAESGEAAAARLTGTLVHRLFRRIAPIDDEPALLRQTAALIDSEERAAIPDIASFVARTASTYAAMRVRDDVRAIFENGEPLFEVPFSWRVESGDVLRGAIDCLVARRDGSVVVVDFKTGREQPGHREQLDVYVKAASTLFPGRRVEGVLLYA